MAERKNLKRIKLPDVIDQVPQEYPINGEGVDEGTFEVNPEDIVTLPPPRKIEPQVESVTDVQDSGIDTRTTFEVNPEPVVDLPDSTITGKLQTKVSEKFIDDQTTFEVNPEDVSTMEPVPTPSLVERIKSKFTSREELKEPLKTESSKEEDKEPLKIEPLKEEPKKPSETKPESEPKTELVEKPKEIITEKSKRWETFKQNIFGSKADQEYARKGGYTGRNKESLESENESLKSDITTLNDKLIVIDGELVVKRRERDSLITKKSRDKTLSEEDQSKLDDLRTQIAQLESRRAIVVQEINDTKESIRKNNKSITDYENAVIQGKYKEEATRKSLIGKKLQHIGEGAAAIKSGTEGIRTERPWFGPKGFLAKPGVATTLPIEPVHGGSTRLSSYTRLTGQSVKGGIGEALTTVRPSKIISPLGVPGTVAGAKEQFSYRIPAKVIPLSSVKSANINPAILPNIYDVKPTPQVSSMMYKQVIQPDGSVVNVPVAPEVQQRKSKIMTISVNRYKSKQVGSSIPKLSNSVKFIIPKSTDKSHSNSRDAMISRGIGSVGNIKTISKLDVDIGGLGPKRSLKPINVSRQRPEIELGLIDIKQTGMKIHLPSEKNEAAIEVIKTHDRKSKKSFPMVNLDAPKQITKNINNIISKQKRKH